MQLLFATGKSFTVDGLREKLREFFRQEVRPELRAVAALNNVEVITALISFNRQLGLVGLQLRILNGVVSLLTSRVENKALATYVSEQSGASANLQLTTGALEVLACIAFRQPISGPEYLAASVTFRRAHYRELRSQEIVKRVRRNPSAHMGKRDLVKVQRFQLCVVRWIPALKEEHESSPPGWQAKSRSIRAIKR